MQFLNAFDSAMNKLDEKFKFLASAKQFVSSTDEADKVKVLLLSTISSFCRIVLVLVFSADTISALMCMISMF